MRIYEKIIGVRGAFATRIAYVSVDGKPPKQHYQLIVADADGENPRMILQSDRPLMSPAWSADGEWLAYVSFERRVSAVYVQQVRSGKRSMVSARAGINGAPSWSPDGKKLALTLSGNNGNLDIYLLDLGTQALTRLTDDPGIDTEAVFTPDGSAIYFTSDRSGNPQVYKLGAGRQRAPAARHLHRRLQCAPARLARRQAARGAHARRRRVSHRHPGPGHQHHAGAVEGPPG